MSATIASTPRPIREPRNGVNTPVLLATINAVKETPALAKFQFRASNRWMDGTHSETRSNRSPARAANIRTTGIPLRCRPSSRARRPGSRSDARRIPPPRTGRVHHRRHRQHRRSPRRDVDVGGVKVEGDIDSQGISGWPTRSATATSGSASASRSPATRRQKAARNRRAVARAIRSLRCADQRRAG